MKIKITVSDRGTWYRDMVGEFFEVKEELSGHYTVFRDIERKPLMLNRAKAGGMSGLEKRNSGATEWGVNANHCCVVEN
ncbi:hypothetical protein KKF61_05885 [Patescibacteria group bacterium]|nr:hypothetical protein [Patescibacteria group bacterium]MBU0963926.1 hypothetical protein [Patescibacteria group bacterium]